MIQPARGEVWLANLDPTRGHEQAGCRPVLVVTDDRFNRGPARLVVVLPMTSSLRQIATRVRLSPPEGGLKVETDILCDSIRSIAKERFVVRWGTVSPATLEEVADRLRILLKL